VKPPPAAILVTFCPHCGRVSCAITAEEKKRERVGVGTCEICRPPPRGHRWRRFVHYELAAKQPRVTP
jgi:hypothetical protein